MFAYNTGPAFDLEEAWILDNAHELFVRNLKFWLKKRGVRPADLARKLEISPSTISQWYAGRGSPELRTVTRIVKILNIPSKELFHDPEAQIAAAVSRVDTDDVERSIKNAFAKLGYDAQFKLKLKPQQ